MSKNFLFAAIFCALAVVAAAKGDGEPQRGYRFVLTIEGNDDSVMYLGNYYAGRTYATDTARRDRKGRFVFEQKNRPIFPGLYFFSNPGGNYVEFVVYHEKPDFAFTTQEKQWTDNMKVKGSPQNEFFFRFHRTNRHYYDLLDDAKATLSDSAYKAFSDSVMHEFDSLKVALINDNPTSLLAIMMNATRLPETPTYDSTGRPLTDNERYLFFLDHYWDNMALGDDALVRTPDLIFHKRVVDYFDRYLRNATPDVIIPRIDTLLAKAKPSKENFKYLVHTLSEKYLQSNVMSYDAIYVHMIQAYYATGEAFWASPSTIDDNVARANKWEKLLIGKDAPELILRTADGQPRSLHALKSKYTLLVFWSPTCGHCKVMIPELYQKFMIYKDKYDIDAFTLLSEPDDHTHELWIKFIQDHNFTDDRWLNLDGAECNIDWHDVYDIVTTPQIYLLDKDKHILAKKLNAELFEQIILALEGANQ
ncbi:MAG: DUF5106 domain-containing protein [Bacteroidales bacterium]|nr:DUF5106 domain-containing protein [Bacteroidales bacterium]